MQGVRFDSNGLVPAIVQDARTGQVRMLGYMNREAVKRTIETGTLHFYSRSRQTLWKKGETSGNVHHVVNVRHDCDGDTLLVQVIPDGPTCHTGTDTCFDDGAIHSGDRYPEPYSEVLHSLAAVIADRRANPVDGSYTNYLLNEGIDKVGKKIGEESAEVIIACKNDDDSAVALEAADLIYHLLVMLEARDVPVEAVLDELKQRRGAGTSPNDQDSS
jgi:phosphoribosyl-AMP cyclohydrolase / phosphoribosyl-ATP pyrophosphohydrolase